MKQYLIYWAINRFIRQLTYLLENQKREKKRNRKALGTESKYEPVPKAAQPKKKGVEEFQTMAAANKIPRVTIALSSNFS